MLIDSLENKEKILGEFLKICQFEGWNEKSLKMALQGCQIDENLHSLIFENGVIDLVNFYIDSFNKKSAIKFEPGTKIRDKIRLSLYSRFEAERDNKIAIQRLVNFFIDPKNLKNLEMGPRPIISGMAASFKIADFIWKNIDDQSTDFNYYTKRATLAKIIFRATAVFLKDGDYKKIIDEEIENVMRFEKIKSNIKKTFCEIFIDEKGGVRTPKDLVKNLPFFRLFS